MRLYHISSKQYATGERVSANNFGGPTYYHLTLSPVQREIDVFLSEEKPEREPSRLHCIYAFDKIEYCVFFKKRELLGGEDLHLYCCEMESEIGHPMLLVGKMQSVDNEKKLSLRTEYWKPSKQWKFKEYMSVEMVVVEEVIITEELKKRAYFIGFNDYCDDARIYRLL